MLFAVFSISVLLVRLEYAWEEKEVGYSLYEVTAFNKRERAELYSLHTKNNTIVFINGVTNEAAIPMNVLVEECCTKEFEDKLLKNDIEITYIRNYSLLNEANSFAEDTDPHPHDLYVDISQKFNSWRRIYLWIIQNVKKYSIMKKIIVGRTNENRDIIILKVSTGKKGSAVFIVGGEEGRDWMSPAIILNFMKNLVENKHGLNMTDYYDFYFLPVMNPDGYEYSINGDMLWTKNRKLFFPQRQCPSLEGNDAPERVAIGVNIDRNWFLTQPSYVRNEECESVYIGYRPLNEEEPQALSKFIRNMAVETMAFIDLRGFERLITIPYGFSTIYCNNHEILMEILSSICEGLQEEHNTTYFLGNTANLMYNVSGNSADWVKKNLNVPIVFTVYMKYENYLFPNAKHIQPLTEQFTHIIGSSLIVAHHIYGSLFSNQVTLSANFVIILITIFIMLINITN